MTFNVRDPEIETKLRDIGRRIDAAIKDTPGLGFALFLVQTNNVDGGLFYISSVNRDDIVPVIAQWAARQQQ